MNNNLPAAALGHFVMKVDDINISYQFYEKLGLRPCEILPDLAIIELLHANDSANVITILRRGKQPEI